MTESSLTRLSDFLAEAVASKCVRMTDENMDDLGKEAEAYGQIFTLWRSLYAQQQQGDDSREKLFNIFTDAKNRQLEKISREFNYDELHMECVHAQPVPESVPLNIFLVYSIKVGEVVFLFQCQAGTDGVFNYHVEHLTDNCGIEDAWDYYIQHTPCAVV